MRKAGAGDAANTLATRIAAQVSLTDPGGVFELLYGLREAGARDAVNTLAARAANAGMFDLFLLTHLDKAYRFGREPDGAESQPWRWQEPISKPTDD